MKTSNDFMTARTGKMYKSDGTRFDEADYMSRVEQAMTSFNEVGVAQNHSLIDMKSVYPLSAMRDKVVGANGGSVTQADGMFKVSTTTNADSSVTFSSVERGRYVAGFDSIAGLGMMLSQEPTGNQDIEFGYTDFVNGVVIGYDSQGTYVKVYSGSEEKIKKYVNFDTDLSDLNIFRIIMRWYGRGPATIDLSTEENDKAVTQTVFTTPIIPGELFTENPNQPLSVRVRNNGTAEALECFNAGRQYFVRGTYNPLFRISSDFRLEQSISTTFLPMVSMRQKSGDYASVATKLSGFGILSDADLLVQARIFSELTGASWVDPGFSDSGVESAMEFDKSATAISGGIKVYEGLVPGGQGNRSAFLQADLPNLELPSNGDVISLCARTVTGSATASSVLRVREEW